MSTLIKIVGYTATAFMAAFGMLSAALAAYILMVLYQLNEMGVFSFLLSMAP